MTQETSSGTAAQGPVLQLEDLAAAHQIVLRSARHGGLLTLSCTCLRLATRGRPRWKPIDARPVLPAPVAQALWRKFHAERGVAV
jgi:hypothetical protein